MARRKTVTTPCGLKKGDGFKERALPGTVFPRRLPKIPTQMQRSAELWLDIFMGFSAECIAAERENTPNHAQLLTALEHARVLTDAALTMFEERWPGVKL